MNNNFNTNINEYSIDDLYTLLELESTDPTQEEIIDKIDYLINTFFQNNFQLQAFFNAVQNKLLNSFTNINSYVDEDILPVNNFIETMANIHDDDDTENEEDDNTENEEDDNTENEEENDNNEEDNNTENEDNEEDNEKSNEINEEENRKNTLSTVSTTSYNIFDLIKKDTGYTENYFLYNFLHFNTLFRDKTNTNLATPIPPTNSNFILSSPINNISEIKLASINIRKPFLISEEKANNKFTIKKYKTTNTTSICDFSSTITIDNGYYSTSQELENFLNNTYFDASNTSDTSFLKNIHFSIDTNTGKSKFDYSYNEIDASFSYFEIDFRSHYTPYYSLANILGFDYYKVSNYTSINDLCNNPINNTTLKSPYTFNNKGNNEIFLCFDEYQSNIIETHKLFLNNNMSTNKILAKINTSLGTKDNNFYINETFSKSKNRYDIIRKYDGVINLLNFNVKIIDYYGNIINSNSNEDFTFTLEVKINHSRLISK
jgi:hypothetical protein